MNPKCDTIDDAGDHGRPLVSMAKVNLWVAVEGQAIEVEVDVDHVRHLGRSLAGNLRRATGLVTRVDAAVIPQGVRLPLP